MKKCKVIGCKDHVMEGEFGVKELEGHWGYCQIHKIEGLIKEKKKNESRN
ncbi:MAG: hypothetical protein ACFFDN_50840 [Candidatus Hodarchaeota archaeon]